MRGALAFTLASAGVLWCAALMILLPPAFSHGDDWLVPLAIPLGLAIGAFLALRHFCHHGRGDAPAAVLISLLFAYSVITGFSIGMAVMPAALLLLTAHAAVPAPR